MWAHVHIAYRDVKRKSEGGVGHVRKCMRCVGGGDKEASHFIVYMY